MVVRPDHRATLAIEDDERRSAAPARRLGWWNVYGGKAAASTGAVVMRACNDVAQRLQSDRPARTRAALRQV